MKSSPVFEKGHTGLIIYDPIKKKPLYEHNSEKYFTPASNTKLFTFYTGLKVLGDSVPALKYIIRNDSLIFTGTGDPSLLNPNLPESRVPDFLMNHINSLFYLPPGTEETVFGPGWAWDDYNDYYSVERSAFPIYGNQVSFTSIKTKELPVAYPSFFLDSLFFDQELTKNIRRDLKRNRFRFPKDFRNREKEQIVPFKTSVQTAIQLLEDTIRRPIEILPAGPTDMLDEIIYSIPTDSLYKKMLQDSDNFIAEQILLMAANEIADTLKTKSAIKFMKETHLQDLPDEPIWVDGSGLSRYNLETPQNMVKLLEKIKNEVAYSKLFQLLPAGGKSGTMKNQFEGEPPYIFAKTGSLSNNYSLSGYLLTKKGKILIFSFMNSNFVVSSGILKREMERILQMIRNNN